MARSSRTIIFPLIFDFTDYPNLVAKGERIPTIAVPTILTAYNWRADSDRYRRVARFVDDLFSRVDKLQAPGFDAQMEGRQSEREGSRAGAFSSGPGVD